MGRTGAIALLSVASASWLALVVLGLVTPFGDPLRDRVDNALFLLGTMGLMNALLVGRVGLIAESPGVRVLLGVFAALSCAALGLADFGRLRTVGWGMKAVGVALLAVIVSDLIRRGIRSSR